MKGLKFKVRGLEEEMLLWQLPDQHDKKVEGLKFKVRGSRFKRKK